MSSTPLLEVRSISRAFHGVSALSGVDFDVHSGEVHALVGENGAGKSTLLSIMNGLLPPDTGEIRINGKITVLGSASDAIIQRLAMVHQELVLCPNLSVAENIYLGREAQPNGRRASRRDMMNMAQQLLDDIHVELDPAQIVGELSLNEQQIVEICRALASDPQVIVFDEPTASLDDDQVEHLLEIIRQLRDRGLGIVYVSHRLKEIFAIADRITVLRDGCAVDTLPAADLDERKLVSLMVGREYDPSVSSYQPRQPGAIALEVANLTVNGVFHDLSFTLRQGEILGIAGLLGCQREAVVRSIFAALPADSGTISVLGKPVRLRNPRQAIANGISFMPADRKEEGLVLDMSVEDNLTLTVLKAISHTGMIHPFYRNAMTRKLIQRLAVKTSSPRLAVHSLSGGNQQKIVIGKWIARNGEIIIAEDPTRGVDVGAKAEIWSALQKLAAEGKAIILLTTELEELMGASDRILVMSRGNITGEFKRHDFDAERIARCFVA